MYKRILIAADGSPTSSLALREAAKIADANTSLLVVTVADNASLAYTVPYDLGAVHQAILEQARAALQQASGQLAELGLQAETRLIDLNDTNSNNIPVAILIEAKAWAADLIILGTHGRRGVRRFFLGSVAEQIARMSSRPVLLVRSPPASLSASLNPAEVYADWPEDEVMGG